MDFSKAPTNLSNNVEYESSTPAEHALAMALALGGAVRKLPAYMMRENKRVPKSELGDFYEESRNRLMQQPQSRNMLLEASRRSQMAGDINPEQAIASFRQRYSDWPAQDTAKSAAAVAGLAAGGAGIVRGLHGLLNWMGDDALKYGSGALSKTAGHAMKRAIPGVGAYLTANALLNHPKGPAGALLSPFVPTTGRGLTEDEASLAEYLTRQKPGHEHRGL